MLFPFTLYQGLFYVVIISIEKYTQNVYCFHHISIFPLNCVAIYQSFIQEHYCTNLRNQLFQFSYYGKVVLATWYWAFPRAGDQVPQSCLGLIFFGQTACMAFLV